MGPTLAEVARIWNAAGVSTIPVLCDGTKKPAIRWGEYQVHLPLSGDLDQWWGNGHARLGLALICGNVSSNLEMTELEADAAGGEFLELIQDELEAAGFGYLWYLLTTQGYMEWTPSGGIHFLYRICDHAVPGNTKIAVNGDRKVLSETRGEGGYVIVAPTSGLVHPTGESWSLAAGTYGEVPSLTWDQRCALHNAIFKALDCSPDIPVPSAPLPVIASPATFSGVGARPGDMWAAETSWRDLVEGCGFRYSHCTGVEEYYTRPGKNPRDGHSITINYQGSDLLKVFSTNIPELVPDATYTKLGFLAAYQFGGNFHATTQWLVSQGYGAASVMGLDDAVLDTQVVAPAPVKVRLDEDGVAKKYRQHWIDKFGYVPVYCDETATFMTHDQRKWAREFRGAMVEEYFALLDGLLERAEANNNETETRFFRRFRSMAKADAVLRRFRTLPGTTVSITEMDTERDLLNLLNGTLNLRTGQLLRHDPGHRITRVFNANYDPSATCPRFLQFMEEVLPDPEIRAYVQRAIGYTLLGNADQRALFLIYGPSGTGKSQFIETLRMVFADYGATAPPGTFKASRDKAPTHDLHQLRGRRFVATSETAEGTSFDEDLIKRLTGRDEVSSRDLYERHQSWTPECSVWIATNHPPRFTSDDDAIWRRAKLIPFLTQFTPDGQYREIPDLARSVLIHEADGILNWILAGLRDFLASGLGEPDQVREAVEEHRSQSDPVTRCLDDLVVEGRLLLGEAGSMSENQLHVMYQEWCRQTGERALGLRRFSNRVESGRLGLRRGPGRMWIGITRNAHVPMFGQMVPTS